MRTIKERAQKAVKIYKGWMRGPGAGHEDLEILFTSYLEMLLSDCVRILEDGSKPQKGLTDHAYRGDSRLGHCSCGLQKAAHPTARLKSRKQIIKEIRALAGEKVKP